MNDWIEWHGGECPVPAVTLVQCRLREDVGWNMESRPAREWDWYSDVEAADIVAYRVVGGAPQVGERDPNGTPPGAPGAKLDAGKLKAGVLADFSLALKAVAEIGTFGANKYSRGGWQHVENGRERYTDAMWRHLLAGGGTDDQSNLLHEAHFAWNVLARLELLLRQTKSD